jgi:hypothetical protein
MKTPREKQLIARFWWLGGIGAMLLGSGLAVLLHAADLNRAGHALWFWIGTGGYALIMSGIGLIGHANRFRTLADVIRELDERDRQRIA